MKLEAAINTQLQIVYLVQRSLLFGEKYLDLDSDVGCADEQHVIGEYIRGYKMHAATPWHTIDYIFFPVHVKEKFHWVLVVISLNDKCINVYDSYGAASHDAAIMAEKLNCLSWSL